jgi:hypothetical protein
LTLLEVNSKQREEFEGTYRNFVFCESFRYNLLVALDKIKEMNKEIAILKQKLLDVNSTWVPPSLNALTLVPLDETIVTHAFLTHNWGNQSDNYENHRRVAKIYRELKDKYQMKMWFDEDYLTNNIRSEITKGVASSLSMLVFITREYDRKISGQSIGNGIYCKLEFEQGFERFYYDERLIPIIMEEEMLNTCNWSHDLKGVFNGKLYFDFTKINIMNDEEFSLKCHELFDFIINRLKVEKKNNI